MDLSLEMASEAEPSPGGASEAMRQIQQGPDSPMRSKAEWDLMDLNHRPPGYEPDALTELS